MRKTTMLILMLIALVGKSYCQGISFEKDLSWKDVLQKAKKENKYIFVDVFATWCLPCKKMDLEVYTNIKVAKFVNDNFISIKVQIDTSKNDIAAIQSWYADARAIQQKYNVTSLPTLLYFSPDGKIIHKKTGAVDSAEFISISKEALDPSFQFYTLMDQYNKRELNIDRYPYLALHAKNIGEKKLADNIIDTYMGLLEQMPQENLLKRPIIELCNTFPQMVYKNGSNGIFFKLFLYREKEVDKAVQYPGFADIFVRGVITKEEISDRLWNKKEPISLKPNWAHLEDVISKKYNSELAQSLVLNSKIIFYRKIGDWKSYKLAITDVIDLFPPKSSGSKFSQAIGDPIGYTFAGDHWTLNAQAWDVFQHCKDSTVLEEALKWSNMSIHLQPKDNAQYLDTKANLLYKLNKRQKAIETEKLAINEDRRISKIRGNDEYDTDNDLYKNLKKMKNNLPTW